MMKSGRSSLQPFAPMALDPVLAGGTVKTTCTWKVVHLNHSRQHMIVWPWDKSESLMRFCICVCRQMSSVPKPGSSSTATGQSSGTCAALWNLSYSMKKHLCLEWFLQLPTFLDYRIMSSGTEYAKGPKHQTRTNLLLRWQISSLHSDRTGTSHIGFRNTLKGLPLNHDSICVHSCPSGLMLVIFAFARLHLLSALACIRKMKLDCAQSACLQDVQAFMLRTGCLILFNESPNTLPGSVCLVLRVSMFRRKPHTGWSSNEGPKHWHPTWQRYLFARCPISSASAHTGVHDVCEPDP